MKAWKFLILLAGLAGLVGFFVPFLRVTSEQANIDQPVSAYRLVKGLDVHEIVREAKGVTPTRANAEQVAKELEEGVSAVRGFALLAYAPAALLALLGAIAVARGQIGRLGGLLALVFGGVSAIIWALLYMASKDTHDAAAGSVALATGAHLLLVAGVGGMLAGFGALFAPDRGD